MHEGSEHLLEIGCSRSAKDETLMLNIRNPNVDILRLCVWDADTFSQDMAQQS